MNYSFDVGALVKNSGLTTRQIKELIKGVLSEFPSDPMMQELHLRRYVKFELSRKAAVQSKAKSAR